MKPEYIIIHCSATEDSGTVSWQAIRRYHMGTLGWTDIGYHAGIELVNNEFELIVGRPLNAGGAHCRADSMNGRSLGICFVGNYDNNPPPPEMLTLGARHVAALCEIFGIPVERVQGHRDFESKKTCPGSAFDMDRFRDMVRAELGL